MMFIVFMCECAFAVPKESEKIEWACVRVCSRQILKCDIISCKRRMERALSATVVFKKLSSRKRNNVTNVRFFFS